MAGKEVTVSSKSIPTQGVVAGWLRDDKKGKKAAQQKMLQDQENRSPPDEAIYTHRDGKEERVQVIEVDGRGGFRIFVPSLNQERDTNAARLTFQVTDHPIAPGPRQKAKRLQKVAVPNESGVRRVPHANRPPTPHLTGALEKENDGQASEGRQDKRMERRVDNLERAIVRKLLAQGPEKSSNRNFASRRWPAVPQRSDSEGVLKVSGGETRESMVVWSYPDQPGPANFKKLGAMRWDQEYVDKQYGATRGFEERWGKDLPVCYIGREDRARSKEEALHSSPNEIMVRPERDSGERRMEMRLRRALKFWDLDESGCLSLEELGKVFDMMLFGGEQTLCGPKHRKGISQQTKQFMDAQDRKRGDEFDILLKRFDTDGSGEAEISEISARLMQVAKVPEGMPLPPPEHTAEMGSALGHDVDKLQARRLAALEKEWVSRLYAKAQGKTRTRRELHIRNMLMFFDLDKSGQLDEDEMTKAFLQILPHADREDVSAVVESYICDGEEAISITEAMERIKSLSPERVVREDDEGDEDRSSSSSSRTTASSGRRGLIENPSGSTLTTSATARREGAKTMSRQELRALKARRNAFLLFEKVRAKMPDDNHLSMLKSVRRILEYFDDDETGSLDHEEMAKALRCYLPTLGDEDVRDLVAFFDHDNDGEITVNEFAKKLLVGSREPTAGDNDDFEAVQEIAQQLHPVASASTLDKVMDPRLRKLLILFVERLEERTKGDGRRALMLTTKRLFKHFDKDESGHLDLEEFRESIRFFLPSATDLDVNLLFNYFDASGDGNVETTEILECVMAVINERDDPNAAVSRSKARWSAKVSLGLPRAVRSASSAAI